MAQRTIERPASQESHAEFGSVVGRWHRGWRLDPPHTHASTANELTGYRLGEIDVVGCRVGPCSGTRVADREAHLHDGAEIAILVVHLGRERVSWPGHVVPVEAGEALVWDTRASGRFEVDEHVDKSTIFLPRALVATWVPELDRLLTRNPIPSTSTLALRSLFRAVDETPPAVLQGQSSAALAAALKELAFLTLGAAEHGHEPRQTRLWREMTQLIEDRLPDTVTADDLAAALAVSVRTVYQTFADHGSTVRGHSRRRRLARARDDLLDARRDATIAGVAHRWGFPDQSSFTKAFRRQFGTTPGALRAGR